eukprot:13321241-Ditylum_brightwellii.AAC.1
MSTRRQEGDSQQRVGSNSKKLAAAVRNKTAAVEMANQDSDAKPVKKETGREQQGSWSQFSMQA